MALLTSFSIRSRFRAKCVAAFALVALGDAIFYQRGASGSAAAFFALGWAVITAFFLPGGIRRAPSWTCLAFALLCVGALFDDPAPIDWIFFWIAITLAAVLPRAGGFDDALRWSARLAVYGITSLVGPAADLRRLSRSRRRTCPTDLRRFLPILALPVAGTLVFLLLFASANPVIGSLFAAMTLPAVDLVRIALWLLLLLAGWGSLRPRRIRLLWAGHDEIQERILPGVNPQSVLLSLILFNLLFAFQNGLDILFLWSGARLPDGVTLADYAHRGAYTLIATALLAGMFVLVALRQGSEPARVPVIRRLVVAWTAQNIFLVTSCILRTIDYVDAYSLTRLRIAALAWMALVAIGLGLICVRLMRARSGAWLINANAAMLGIVMSAAMAVDLGSVSAAWNVRHAREVGGGGAALDLCYLSWLGPSSLVSLAELEQQPISPAFRERVAFVRRRVQDTAIADQAGGGWTWRNARRLNRVEASGLPVPKPSVRDCDGRLIPPDPAAEQPPSAAAPPVALPPSLTTGTPQ